MNYKTEIFVNTIFIGSGPSSLFACYYLYNSGYDDFLVFEKGTSCKERFRKKKENSSYSVVSGVGGAGLFSDGKLNFSKYIGGKPLSLMSEMNFYSLENLLKNIILVKPVISNSQKIKDFNRKYKNSNIRFLEIEQAHIGSDKLPGLINRLMSGFQEKIRLNTEIIDVDYKGEYYHIVTNTDERYKCKNLIIAVGQTGSKFSKNIANKFNVKTNDTIVDIGVRLETKKDILDPLTNIQYDPKIYFDYENCSVRTFCTNPGGEVIVEKKDDFMTVNGHADSTNNSGYSNLALMCQLNNLPEPRKYSDDLCRKISKASKNGIAVQDVSDFLGRRSRFNKEIKFNHSFLKLEELYDPDIFRPIIQSIIKLDIILNKTLIGLVYFPETKLYNTEIDVEKDTFRCVCNTPGLFMIGDCVGTIHGLTNSCLSGLSFALFFMKRQK